MIILNRKEIEALIDYEKAINAIREAFIAVSRGEVNLPPVGHITFPDEQADCHIKYGHMRGQENFVIKIATGFPNNTTDIPNNNGLSLVLSAQTGEVKAVLHDEAVMTDIRTGIAAAIASKALGRANSKSILIVGTGIQAQRQIEAHTAIFGKDMKFTIWGRSFEKAEAIAAQFQENLTCFVSDDLETACKQADFIVTTTGTFKPIIEQSWIKRGTHITAVGADAPGKQELQTELVTTADIIATDIASQCLDHGEIATAEQKGLLDHNTLVEFGDLLAGKKTGRTNDDQITIADLTGIAAQDIAIANVVLDQVY